MLLTVTKQKALKMLTRACRDLAHDAAQPNQIAHRFMLSVRYPHGRQLSGAVKTGEHGGVTTICLHSIAGLLRNQRRSHHLAPMTEARELPMNAITTWSGLVTKRQRLPGTPQTFAQLADRTGIIGNLAQIFQCPRASVLSHGDRDPFLVNVQANKSGMLHEARLLCMRLCTGHPA